MVWRQLLRGVTASNRVAVFAASIYVLALAAPATSPLCPLGLMALDKCPRGGVSATVNEESVDLIGKSFAGGAAGEVAGRGNGSTAVDDPGLEPGDPGFYLDRDLFDAEGPLELKDLASFHPTKGSDASEPKGWTVVGLDTNFYATAAPNVQRGTLLGDPASVRFTPAGYLWDYGDAETATLTAGGASWAALGLQEFDATPTSHVFRRAGTFTVRLSIAFSAEYQLAGEPWVAVDGYVTAPANEISITAGSAKTVLVGRDCEEKRRAPGC